MSVYLSRLARWSVRQRRLVLAVWLLVAIGVIAAAQLSGGKTDDNFTIPGTEAQQASDLLKAKLPALSGSSMQVVLAESGADTVTSPAAKAAIEQTLTALRSVPQVVSVADPYQQKQVSPDNRVALVNVQFSAGQADVHESSLNKVKDAVRPAQDAGVRVEYSGQVFPGSRLKPSELPELIGIVIALLILFITFAVLSATVLPIITAVVGVLVTLMAVTTLASVVSIASASTTIATMLGLSCGIDYGLFILSRHRANLLRGMSVEDSMGLAAGTAGGSVVFAGLTVIIALCGLSVVGIPFLTVMGLAGAASVAIALLIAMTLVPAALGFVGERVVRPSRFARLRRRQEHVNELSAADSERGTGTRWARFVVRFRAPVVVIGIVLLGVIALPATRMQLGLPSGESKPKSSTQRQAYDLITSGFGAGANGTLQVVASPVTSAAVAQPIAARIAGLPDVVSSTVTVVTKGVAVIKVVPKTGPNDSATADLVHRIRDDRTTIEGTSQAHVLVGGTTASNIDVSAKLSSALPIFLLVVVGLAFVLLTFAFRTILVPIKSILGFLLSVVAAFGAQTALFQWGWGEHIFGITKSETISFLPIIMLAIIFGLSSDYEVFVVSRIKEEQSRTGDAQQSVVRGTGHAARVVTAAALIMFSIFVAFMFNNDPTIKAIGFSFAVGVFLDAFVVRLTLVPAVMSLIGSRIWWHPQWFARYVPDPDIEGRRLEQREPELVTAGGAQV